MKVTSFRECENPNMILIKHRIVKNMSQAQVADEAHINRGYYSSIERGLLVPSNQILKDIAKVLDIEDWKSLIPD